MTSEKTLEKASPRRMVGTQAEVVSAIPHSVPQHTQATPMTEDELDQHIKDCGKLIQKAIDDGDRAAAVDWQDAMYRAIRLRTPAHKARLESKIMARIEDPANCYFSEAGALARFQRTGVVA